ncbi:MAG: phosphoesterase [Clostridia bacterium]|nr:phosphoesterase [Clostridia bacterium]
MIDIHAHILPGIDDGAKDEQMTKEMLARAADAGISSIICTPHVYRADSQKNNCLAFPGTKELAKKHGISLAMGCEFNYRVLLKTGTEALDEFCLAGTPCILIEFSNDRLVPDWEILLTEIVEKGYMPIIAHPERYAYVQKDIGIAEEMLRYGCELQVDAGGLMAGLFSAERKIARKMLSEGMVSYIASDAHRPEHYATFDKVRRTFKAEWPEDNQLTRMLNGKR